MKKCNSCGSLYPDEGRFCPECGGADAVILPDGPAAQPDPAPQPRYQQPVQGVYQPPQQPEAAPQGLSQPDPAQQGYYQPPYQPDPAQQNAYQAPAQGGYQAPAGEYVPPQGAYQPGAPAPAYAPPAKPKKKKSGCLIAVIIVGVLVIIGGVLVAVIAGKIAKEVTEEMDPNSLIDEFLDELAPDDTPAAAYTKGTLTDNVYVNEWAGVQFKLPEGLANGSDADYAKYTNEHVDACLVTGEGNEQGQVLLLIEDVSRVNIHYPPDDYLEIFTEKWLDEDDVEQGWTKTEPYSRTIAGKGYRVVALNNESLGYMQLAACRCVDGKMICFCVWGTADNVDSFLNSVTAP